MDFDDLQYLGKWFELERINNIIQKDMECVVMDFSKDADDAQDLALKTRAKDTGEWISVHSVVRSVDRSKATGHYEAHIDQDVWQGKFADVKVVDTDYVAWAVVWSCGELTKQGWILARSKNPSAEILAKINLAKSQIKLADGEWWRTTKQDDELLVFFAD